MKRTILLCLLGIFIGLSARLLLPLATEAAAGKTAEAGPNRCPAVKLPEKGVQTDAFSLHLFQKALERQPEADSVLVAPYSTKILLGSMAEQFELKGEAAAQIAPTQQGIDDSGSSAPVELSVRFMADQDLQRARDSALKAEWLPFRSDYPEAVSQFNARFASFFKATYNGTQHYVTQETRLVAQELSRFAYPWLCPFRRADTDKGDFDNADGALPQVEMMRCRAPFRMAEAEDGSWKAIALFFAPQKGKGATPVAFIGIIPQGNAREFAANLTPEQLSAVRTALAKAEYAMVRVELPRMGIISAPTDATALLQDIGITAPFDIRQADFSTLTPEKIAMNGVIQRIAVSLTEDTAPHAKDEQIEAAGPAISFNRPFLWLICDLTTPTAPYFIGLVENL